MRQIPTAFLFAAVVADSSGALAVAAASDISFFKQPVTLGEGPSQCANLLSSPWSADQSWIGSAEIDDADNGDEMSRDFLFMHIPKTAGTSFGGQLSSMITSYAKRHKKKTKLNVQHCYDSTHLLPTNVNKCFGSASFDNSISLYKAHADILYAERLPAGTRIVTMLRDPHQLTTSRYLYQWRNAEPNPPPLAQWSAKPQNMRSINNRQVRTLSGGLCCVPGKELVNLGKADCSDSIAEAVQSGVRHSASRHRSLSEVPTLDNNSFVDGCPADCEPGSLLANAKRMLVEGVFFFGLVERYAESLALLAWQLGIPPPCLQKPLNTARSPNAKFTRTEAVVNQTVAGLTQLDSELYNFAEEIFERRWQALMRSSNDRVPYPNSAYLPENLRFCNGTSVRSKGTARQRLEKASHLAAMLNKHESSAKRPANNHSAIQAAAIDTQLNAVDVSSSILKQAGVVGRSKQILQGFRREKQAVSHGKHGGQYSKAKKFAKPSREEQIAQLNKVVKKSAMDKQFQAALEDLPQVAVGSVIGAGFGHAKHNFGVGKAKTGFNSEGTKFGSVKGMPGLAASQVDTLGALARAAGHDNTKRIQSGDKSSSKVRPPPSSPEGLFERFANH